MAVVCIIKEDSFDQPANVDHNIDAFKKGLFEMLQLTSTLKIWFTQLIAFIINFDYKES